MVHIVVLTVSLLLNILLKMPGLNHVHRLFVFVYSRKDFPKHKSLF